MSPPEPLARVTFRTDEARWTLRCDSAAWFLSGRYDVRPLLWSLSVAGADVAVRAAWAMLVVPTINVTLDFRRLPGDEEQVRLERPFDDRKFVPMRCRLARLAPGLSHLVAYTSLEGFLPEATDAALWAELAGPRFTTPLLPVWLGPLRRALAAGNHLRGAQGYRQNAARLTIDPEGLDKLVSRMVREGDLRMEETLQANHG